MKRLKKGFTLIELLVVIAIIGILATTLAPKLREQLAKAKDAKGIAALGAARVGAGVAFTDDMVSDGDGNITLADIQAQLETRAAEAITGSSIVIGGGRATDGSDVIYSGSAVLAITTGAAVDFGAVTAGSPSTTVTYSTEGKLWSTY